MPTKIEWAQSVWNPTRGCSKVSHGCNNCYAIRMAHRLAHMPATAQRYAGLAKKTEHGLEWTGTVATDESALHIPVKNKKPTIYFVDSMSDIFHASVPFAFIDRIFAAMAASPQHVFIVLTKRPEQAFKWFNYQDKEWANEGMQGTERIRYQALHTLGINILAENFAWPLPNVIMGVSIESQKYIERLHWLVRIPAATRCISAEPLLGELDLHFTRIAFEKASEDFLNLPTKDLLYPKGSIDWVIAGGESGPGARPCNFGWATKLQQQCKKAGIAFFFKQWGEYLPLCEWYKKPFFTKNKTIYTANERGQAVDVYDYYKTAEKITDENTFYKVGKKLAGSLLNGQQYRQLPEVINQFFEKQNK